MHHSADSSQQSFALVAGSVEQSQHDFVVLHSLAAVCLDLHFEGSSQCFDLLQDGVGLFQPVALGFLHLLGEGRKLALDSSARFLEQGRDGSFVLDLVSFEFKNTFFQLGLVLFFEIFPCLADAGGLPLELADALVELVASDCQFSLVFVVQESEFLLGLPQVALQIFFRLQPLHRIEGTFSQSQLVAMVIFVFAACSSKV